MRGRSAQRVIAVKVRYQPDVALHRLTGADRRAKIPVGTRGGNDVRRA